MHIGYSIDWKQIIVITWGGLRGAVGLALALVVAQTPQIPQDTIGSKVRTYIRMLLDAVSIIKAFLWFLRPHQREAD